MQNCVFDFAFYVLLLFVSILGFIALSPEGAYKVCTYFKLSGLFLACVKLLMKSKINKAKDVFRRSRDVNISSKQEEPQQITSEKETDTQTIYGLDQQGNSIVIKLSLHHDDLAHLSLILQLSNGTTYVLPDNLNVPICEVQKGKWKTRGLSIFVLEPFRRIRIVYNGLLRKQEVGIKNGDEKVEHIKLNLIWNTSDKPLFHPEDTSNSFLLDAITADNWKDNKWMNILNVEQGYVQYGALQGLLAGEAFPDPVVLYLPCFRHRYWGKHQSSVLHRNASIFVVGEDGTLFTIGAKQYQKGCTQLKYGSLLDNIGIIHKVTDHDFDLQNFSEEDIPDAMTVHIVAKKKVFKCTLHFDHRLVTTTNSHWHGGCETKTVAAKCMLGNQTGVAIATFEIHKNDPCSKTTISRSLLREPKVDNSYNFVVPFSSKYCCTTRLAGGKGSSLGLLTSLNSQTFIVPEGFVVLAPAFDQHVKQNPKLEKGITHIVDICRQRLDKDLLLACKELVDLFTSTMIDAKVSGDILTLLSKLGGDRWAVRSSGVNEDSEDLSAAGQNATILGCSTKDDVLKAVAACWGSLFTFQSVQYRRQHGLDINTSMGVVIQRMIPSEKAGVLFTCHPATGDPSKMVITSNFGIGESVVSGEVDPDTITLNRTWQDQLSIHSQTVGSKKHSVMLSEDGVQNKDSNLKESEVISLTEEEIVNLGKVGIELENAYGSPRDIEWAFYKDKLYLLQSRPITTINNWTDFELLHEFDTPIVTNQELYTVANTGEVFPGATTPLTYSTICEYLSTNIYKFIMEKDKGSFVMKFIGSVNHHITINVTNCFLSKIRETVDKEIKVLDMAIFGHLVIDEKTHAVGKSRFGTMSRFGQMKIVLQTIIQAFKMNAYVKKAIAVARSSRLPNLEGLSAWEMLNTIVKNMESKNIVLDYHARTTRISVFYQHVAISILTDGSEDLTNDHYYDIALLLSSCSDVVSAEVPRILEKIAIIIQESGISDEFLLVNSKEGVDWLRSNCSRAFKELDAFLSKHGHRGYREFELMSDSWGENPTLIIEMLKANCKASKHSKPTVNLTAEETVAKLVTPKNNTIRKILKFLVKRCRKSVSQREATKSEAIYFVNETKSGIRRLAKRMVEEGIISNQSLVYQFSLHELQQVIQNRDPDLIFKATRRQRLHPKWDKIKVPELIYGFPKIEEEDDVAIALKRGDGILQIRGTPVCPGNVVARACVISSLDEIDQLETGDILITCSTDVGWSPYFPMLSAVVTELGGIISHGAVVAREYGLPCIVGVQNATKLFKTGDKVILSGKLGILELTTLEEA